MSDMEMKSAEAPRPRKKRRWYGRTVLLLLVALGGGGAYAWFGGHVPEETKKKVLAEAAKLISSVRPAKQQPKATFAIKPPSVTVAKANKTEIVETAHVSGSLVAREEINVAPEIDGLMIEEVLAQEGDTVAQGQVLARLSKSTLEIEKSRLNAQIARWDAAMAQSKASIAEAEASAEEATKSLGRTKLLRRTNTVSAAALDQSESAASMAKARVSSATEALSVAAADKAAIEAQLKDLEVRLSRTEVKAPKAGVVTKKAARVGAVAGLGGGALFTVLAAGEVELEAEVPEAVLPKLANGQSVSVTPTGFATALTGKIRMIMPEIDQRTRLGKVRVSLPAGGGLRIGAFAKATIEIARRQGIEVPVSALSYDAGSNFVQVVVGGVVRSRLVKVGHIARGEAEVLSGVDAGEEVVERAGSFLRDGDKVTPVQSEEQASVELSSAQ